MDTSNDGEEGGRKGWGSKESGGFYWREEGKLDTPERVQGREEGAGS